MSRTPQDSYVSAMRALALAGSARKHVQSKKYTVSTSVVPIAFPIWNSTHPEYIKLSIPGGLDECYVAFNNDIPAAPTTSSVGTEQVSDGQQFYIYGQTSISLIGVGSGDVTITYYWT